VHEGADLSAVRLRVEGAEDVAVERGRLHLFTAVGEFTLPLPGIANGGPTGAPLALRTDEAVFEVTSPFSPDIPRSDGASSIQADYPEEAYFGSYLGGSDSDWPYDIAVSGQGDILDQGEGSRAVWIVGWTSSTDFPTAPGPTSLSGPSDAFVTKMKREAVYVRPVFSAYIGGSGEDAARGVALDADGNAYLTGWTTSADFPTTADAYDRTYNGCADAFVIRLSSAGDLQYATYLGGSHVTIPGFGDQCGDDEGRAIAVDMQGRVYLTGYTTSQDFPTTSGAYDRTYASADGNLGDDVFVVKMNLAGSGSADLLYATFVGGGFTERGNAIAVDSSGNVYVTGTTGDLFAPSAANDFPTTSGAFDTEAQANDPNAFLFELAPAGNGAADLRYSTYLGATKNEEGYGLALDGSGHAYLCGSTASPDFPTTSGAYDTTCGTDGNCNGGRYDAFVSELNPAGNGAADLLYSTYLGGNYFELFYGPCDIALDAQGDVYVIGDTGSDTGFPITADAYDSTPDASAGDGFVVRLCPQGNGTRDLVYGTYVGGSGIEEGGRLALDEQGRVYVAGTNRYSGFPTTDHALYKHNSGGDDVYLFRLLAPPAPDLSPSTKEVNPEVASVGEVVTFTVRLVNGGTVSATVSLTDTLPAALIPQGTPTASSGPAPTVNGQIITWTGTVDVGVTVAITYAAQITSTGTARLPVVNLAQINDGAGHTYTRRAYVNGYHIYLPLVLRGYSPW